MKYCIPRDNINILLDCVLANKNVIEDNSELNAIFEGAQSWSDSIVVIMYFVTKIIEQKIKLNVDVKPILIKLQALPEELFISYQFFDYKFIEYMMSQERTKNTNLEENILNLQARLNKYEFY